MGKKESSDEYEPDENEVDKGSEDEDQEADEEPKFEEYIGERKAKINRREIVESEDSDKVSFLTRVNSEKWAYSRNVPKNIFFWVN